MKYLFLKSGLTRSNVVVNQRGMALVTAILLLLVLGIMVTVSTQWSAKDIKRTANYTKTREAFYIADAGLQDAINHLNYDSDGNSPGAASNNFNEALTNWPADYTSGDGIDFQDGTYTVVLTDNDDGDGDTSVDSDFTIWALATGKKNGKTSILRAMLHLPRAQGEAAIQTENDLDISGNATVTGIGPPLAHSNANATMGGSVTVGGVTSLGDCTVNGGTVASCDGGSQYEMDIPRIYPKDFKDYAHYIFQDDGKILDRGADLSSTADDVLYRYLAGVWKDQSNNLPSPNPLIFSDMTYNPGLGWQATSVSVPSGTETAPNNAVLYFEEAININGSVGSSTDPWVVKIFSEEDIKIIGSTYLENCQTTSCNSGDDVFGNLFLIAGDDLDTPSLDSPTIYGVIAALDQFNIGGNANLVGTVISNNFDGDYTSSNSIDGTQTLSYSSTDSNIVNSATSTVSGNMTLTHNGPMQLPVVEHKVRILTWKEYTAKDMI